MLLNSYQCSSARNCSCMLPWLVHNYCRSGAWMEDRHTILDDPLCKVLGMFWVMVNSLIFYVCCPFQPIQQHPTCGGCLLFLYSTKELGCGGVTWLVLGCRATLWRGRILSLRFGLSWFPYPVLNTSSDSSQIFPISLRWRPFPYFQRDRSWAEVTCSSWTLARGKCLSSPKDCSLHPPVHSAPTPVWLFKNIDWVYFRSFYSSQEEKKSHSLCCRRGWKRGI